MGDMDYTRKFSLGDQRDMEIKAILTTVYQALQEKGYNPINQIVGYILSEDPTYITNHNNARTLSVGLSVDHVMAIIASPVMGMIWKAWGVRYVFAAAMLSALLQVAAAAMTEK